jgi:hypothetical protein
VTGAKTLNEIDLVLPGEHAAKLLYAVDYPAAVAGGAAVAWLQQRKLAGEWKKKAYQDSLETYVKVFANGLAARPECAADVVLMPASASRLFDPYLTALRELKPELVVVDGLFGKAPGFEAGVNGQTYEQVLAGTILNTAVPPAVSAATHVLIIDDIYNTGNTAGAMITRVRASMAAQPQVTIACVLYVPLEEKNDEFDWQETFTKAIAEEKAGPSGEDPTEG